MVRSASKRPGTALSVSTRPPIRLLTLASAPNDVPALAALGARAVVVPLPAGAEAASRAAAFVDKASEADVSVSFVLDDVARVADMSPWDAVEGRALLSHAQVTILARRTASLVEVRRVCREARLAVGPWPVPEAEAARLRAVGAGIVWAGRWGGWQAAREWVERARGEGFEVVVPVPREALVNAAYDDDTDWPALLDLLSGEQTSADSPRKEVYLATTPFAS